MQARLPTGSTHRTLAAATWLATLLMAATLLVASGCVTTGRDASRPRPPGPKPRSMWELYFAAVEAARYPDRTKISRDLWPVLPDTEKLAWKDGRVLMVTWTRSKYYSSPPYEAGYEFPLYATTWFTAFPAAREHCRAYRGGDVAMRVRQLMGLPPERDYDAFLEVWVRPEDLFRPCPDPEITDSQCQVNIPLVDHLPPEPDGTAPPWHCPTDGVEPRQVHGQFTVVRQAHLSWMCRNWEESYANEKAEDNYPWTALGYTYDWGRPEDPQRLSEYVSLRGAPVVFERLVPTGTYCHD